MRVWSSVQPEFILFSSSDTWQVVLQYAGVEKARSIFVLNSDIHLLDYVML
jgi:hypothetical protein